jgi:hypothetical protein
MPKTVKIMKLKGRVEIPIELDEEKFEDKFLEWIQKMKFTFAGTIEDTSK